MRNLKLSIALLSISAIFSLLVGCFTGSSGTPRTTPDVNVYGLVTGPTVTDKKSYDISFLQNELTPKFDFTGTATGVCATLTTDPNNFLYTLAIRLLCMNLNIYETNQLVKNVNANFGDIKTFVSNANIHSGVASTRFYRIIYNTPGAPYVSADGVTTPQDVSALIIMPQGINGDPLPKDKIKGVVLYYHPTVFSKDGVPSMFDAESSVNLNSYTLYTDFMLAAIYASQGFVVVAPDYVGQGVNKGVMHPYVAFAKTNALSGIYALKAARTALLEQSINLPDNAKLFITSYSEGGAYALWASKLIQGEYKEFMQKTGYNLRRTVGISGAYDVSGAMLDFMYTNFRNSWDPKDNPWNISPGMFESGLPGMISPTDAIDIKAVAAFEAAGSKIGLSSYMITAMIYYDTSRAPFDMLVNKKFYTMSTTQKDCLSVADYAIKGNTPPNDSLVPCQFNYNLADLYNNPVLDSRQIFNQSLAAAGATGYIAGGRTFNATFQNLRTQSDLNQMNNKVQPFIADIRSEEIVMTRIQPNDIYNWETNSPLELIYTKYDSTLPNLNSLKACGKVAGVANVKDRSSPGLVNCIEVDNTKIFQQTQIPGVNVRPILFADHSWIEPELQLVALARFMATESF